MIALHKSIGQIHISIVWTLTALFITTEANLWPLLGICNHVLKSHDLFEMVNCKDSFAVVLALEHDSKAEIYI